MHTGRRQAEKNVACLHIFARQQIFPLDRPDGKACEIVVVAGIEPRHFRGLTADQRAAGFLAAFGNAFDDDCGMFGVELSGREVIEKEQWFRALHDEVVDAHCNEIDADFVVAVCVDRKFHLGADAVVGSHQQRIAHAERFQVEHAAEAADLGVRARAAGGPHERLDQVDQPVAGIDIDARVPVAKPALFASHEMPSRSAAM